MAAIYVKNAGKDSLFAAATDRQGSLMATMHTASGKVERYSYDLFGRRRNADNWLQSVSVEPRFSRGYCMHEHVPEMDMIDMGGRLYDPVLCQFLSPDPYIQDPTNWQNYNRYAYCLQNPMLYTDPTGEKVAWWQAIAATVLSPTPGTVNGLLNVYCNNESGYIQNTEDMWKCFGQGFVVGSVTPVSATSSFTMSAMPLYSLATIVSCAYHKDLGIIPNSLEMLAGTSYIDGDENFWKGIWYGISDRTFSSQQETAGLEFSLMENIMGNVNRVDYLDGAVFSTDEYAHVVGDDGITMGKYSFIEIDDKVVGDFRQYAISAHEGVYMHEYGHIYQSRNYGLLYLPYIGPQSLYSASKKDGMHKWQWYEIEASYYGKRHFTRKYGDAVWTPAIEKRHPTHK